MLIIYKYFIIGDTYARCTLCCSDFNIAHGGRNDVTTHVKGKHHKDAAKASSSSRSIISMFKPKASTGATESEALWAMFVAKHNLPFLASDHANKLFPKMFPDSELAKQVSCGCTKTTAIVREALAPHLAKWQESWLIHSPYWWMSLMTKLTSHALFLSECLIPVWVIAVLGFWICQ